jgi:hypothetical protein
VVADRCQRIRAQRQHVRFVLADDVGTHSLGPAQHLGVNLGRGRPPRGLYGVRRGQAGLSCREQEVGDLCRRGPELAEPGRDLVHDR